MDDYRRRLIKVAVTNILNTRRHRIGRIFEIRTRGVHALKNYRLLFFPNST